MPKNTELNNLTNKEQDILNILWDSVEPLTASAILKSYSHFTLSTCQSTLEKLLKKDLIEVYDIVYNGTALCKNYRPTVSAKEYALFQFTNEYDILKKDLYNYDLTASLVDSNVNTSEIKELDQLLEEYKKSCLANLSAQKNTYD